MKYTIIVMIFFATLTFGGSRSEAKLKLACDMGNEKACQKLLNFKNGKTVPISTEDSKTYSDPFLKKVCNMSYVSWQDLNVRKYKIQSLKKLGVDTPKEAQKWICAGAYGNGAGFDWDIAKWQKAGFRTADDFIAYKKEKATDKARNNKITMDISARKRISSKNILCDASIVKKYPKLFYRHSSANWLDIKYAFPRNRWKSTGVRVEDALKWIDLGFNVGHLSQLKALGINTPDKAIEWICSGVTEADRLSSHINPFFHNVEILYKNHISPREYHKWYKIGKGPYETAQWKKLGVETVSEAQKWINIGVVNSKQLKHWIDAKITNASVAYKWMQVIQPNRKKITSTNDGDTIYGDFIHAIKYKWFNEAKVTDPDEALKWKKLSLNYHEIGKWKKEGYSYRDALPWVKEKINHGYMWIKMKFTLDEAQHWIKAGIDDGYAYRKKGIMTLKEALFVKSCQKIMNTNVFNNKEDGLLYGTIIQSLPGSYLISSMGDVYSIEKFDDRFRPDDTYIQWRVVSTGKIFTYKTVSGALKQAMIVNRLLPEEDACSKYVKNLN